MPACEKKSGQSRQNQSLFKEQRGIPPLHLSIPPELTSAEGRCRQDMLHVQYMYYSVLSIPYHTTRAPSTARGCDSVSSRRKLFTGFKTKPKPSLKGRPWGISIGIRGRWGQRRSPDIDSISSSMSRHRRHYLIIIICTTYYVLYCGQTDARHRSHRNRAGSSPRALCCAVLCCAQDCSL